MSALAREILHIARGALIYSAVMLAIYYCAVEFAGFGAAGVT